MSAFQRFSVSAFSFISPNFFPTFRQFHVKPDDLRSILFCSRPKFFLQSHISAFQRFSVSAFSFFRGTLRAGQFAGAFPFGPRSTDCVFVLLAHTAQKSGKQKPFPAFNFSPLSKAEMTKAESRN
jgi:hypothetical protein